MPKMKVNDIELYYQIHGEGTPLVLISGLGYPMWQWHLMVPYLEKYFQVILLDNRGVGNSDKPAGPYTASMLAKDMLGCSTHWRLTRRSSWVIRWAVLLPKQ